MKTKEEAKSEKIGKTVELTDEQMEKVSGGRYVRDDDVLLYQQYANPDDRKNGE